MPPRKRERERQSVELCTCDPIYKKLLGSYWSMGSQGMATGTLDKFMKHMEKVVQVADAKFPKDEGNRLD